jgi:hypothetical protein
MTQHLYAFGSLCRGELDKLSDVDLLACVETQEQASKLDSGRFSVYTYERLRSLWQEGNPFAWHLHLESKLVFTSDGRDFLRDLRSPHRYVRAYADCAKFMRLFEESLNSLRSTADSRIFHLSCIFLAARNFATCWSFTRGKPNFSRLSPLQIEMPAPISTEAFDILVRARVLSTRGLGQVPGADDVSMVVRACPEILDWMWALMPVEGSL